MKLLVLDGASWSSIWFELRRQTSYFQTASGDVTMGKKRQYGRQKLVITAKNSPDNIPILRPIDKSINYQVVSISIEDEMVGQK